MVPARKGDDFPLASEGARRVEGVEVGFCAGVAEAHALEGEAGAYGGGVDVFLGGGGAEVEADGGEGIGDGFFNDGVGVAV